MKISSKTRVSRPVSVGGILPAACGGGGAAAVAPSTDGHHDGGDGDHAAQRTLNGTVNPNAQATTAWFEWGTDNTLAAPTLTADQAIGAGSAAKTVSATITGLTSGTTYYYRVAATNASGTQKGAIVEFHHRLAEFAADRDHRSRRTSVTITGATLNGSVIPNELATTAVFEWGTDPSLAASQLHRAQSLGSGNDQRGDHRSADRPYFRGRRTTSGWRRPTRWGRRQGRSSASPPSRSRRR